LAILILANRLEAELFALQELERHAALNTLKKIRQLTWQQVYSGQGLKWEKITSVKPPAGIDAIYSPQNPPAPMPPDCW
jgi:hypothetical protein